MFNNRVFLYDLCLNINGGFFIYFFNGLRGERKKIVVVNYLLYIFIDFFVN